LLENTKSFKLIVFLCLMWVMSFFVNEAQCAWKFACIVWTSAKLIVCVSFSNWYLFIFCDIGKCVY